MLELMFIWIVGILALGFVGVLAVLMTQSLLSALGRLVFIDPEQVENGLGPHAA